MEYFIEDALVEYDSAKYINQQFNKKNNIFFLHDQFQDGESIISWLIRTAHRNHTTARIIFITLSNYNGNTFDYDLYMSADSFSHIYKFIRRNANLKNEYFDQSTMNNASIIIGKYHYGWDKYTHTNYESTFSFCPQCLKENNKPYLKTKWRLSSTKICEIHKCWLLTKCPKCETIQNYRNILNSSFKGNKSSVFTYCINCGFDFRNINTKSVKSSNQYEKNKTMQDKIWVSLQDPKELILYEKQLAHQKYLQNLAYVYHLPRELRTRYKFIDKPLTYISRLD